MQMHLNMLSSQDSTKCHKSLHRTTPNLSTLICLLYYLRLDYGGPSCYNYRSRGTKLSTVSFLALQITIHAKPRPVHSANSIPAAPPFATHASRQLHSFLCACPAALDTCSSLHPVSCARAQRWILQHEAADFFTQAPKIGEVAATEEGTTGQSLV